MITADESGAGAGTNQGTGGDASTAPTGIDAGLAGTATGTAAPAGEAGTTVTEYDQAPAFDPEPPIETPTPTQAEIDDAKRGVRQPDPELPAAQPKKVRNMKPGRDGASTTRDI